METCNLRSLYLLCFALLLIFAVANCTPIVGESEDAVAMLHGSTAPIDGTAGHVRVKRGSCSLGRWACVSSCIAQNCATGYCKSGATGICTCSRCASGRGNVGVNVKVG